MAVTPTATSTAPTAPAPAVPARPLDRSDVQHELTALLRHGHGALLIKVHDFRVSTIELTVKFLKSSRGSNGNGQGEEGSF